MDKQNSTEIVKFEPTSSMQKWLDTAIQLVSDSPSEVAEGCGMDRGNWYKWLQIEGFEDWFYTQYKAKRRRWLPTLDKIGMQNAKRDYNYWKDMKKAAGDDIEKPTTQIQLNNLIKIE